METIKVSQEKGILVIELARPKVNAIDRVMSQELTEVFINAGKDDSVKGVLLTGRENCFSAGLDVTEFVVDGKKGAEEFWQSYLTALQTMVRFEKPFVAALTGYAPAGATTFALCADYRIMGKGEKHVVGMHEFKMSLSIPELMCDIYSYALGEEKAWTAVHNAKLFNSDEAVDYGIVHESCEVSEVLPKAMKKVKQLSYVYQPVFLKTKGYMRKGILERVNRPIQPMVDEILKQWEDPNIVAMMDGLLASITKKK